VELPDAVVKSILPDPVQLPETVRSKMKSARAGEANRARVSAAAPIAVVRNVENDHVPERGVGALLPGGLDRRVRLRWLAD
jgi:hypothetical protein